VNGRKDSEEEQLVVKDKKIENTTEFVHLRSLLTEKNRGVKRSREELQVQQNV